MQIDILTLFPDIFAGVFDTSLIGKARAQELIDIRIHQLRDWATDKHRTVDDTPYGGGPGMVLKVDVIDRALHDLKSKITPLREGFARQESQKFTSKIILLTPQGEKLDQRIVEQLAEENHLILIAGHYEGFDERVRTLVDREISIGDYILTGGELPAMVLTEAVTRLQPGVVGSQDSLDEESFQLSTLSPRPSSLLEYPHYTRPEIYTPMSREVGPLSVPDILKSGDHAKIAAWRQKEAATRTKQRRPDLLNRN